MPDDTSKPVTRKEFMALVELVQVNETVIESLFIPLLVALANRDRSVVDTFFAIVDQSIHTSLEKNNGNFDPFSHKLNTLRNQFDEAFKR